MYSNSSINEYLTISYLYFFFFESNDIFNKTIEFINLFICFITSTITIIDDPVYIHCVYYPIPGAPILPK